MTNDEHETLTVVGWGLDKNQRYGEALKHSTQKKNTPGVCFTEELETKVELTRMDLERIFSVRRIRQGMRVVLALGTLEVQYSQ